MFNKFIIFSSVPLNKSSEFLPKNSERFLVTRKLSNKPSDMNVKIIEFRFQIVHVTLYIERFENESTHRNHKLPISLEDIN